MKIPKQINTIKKINRKRKLTIYTSPTKPFTCRNKNYQQVNIPVDFNVLLQMHL